MSDIPDEAGKTVPPSAAQSAPKRKKGRPPGSKNKDQSATRSSSQSKLVPQLLRDYRHVYYKTKNVDKKRHEMLRKFKEDSPKAFLAEFKDLEKAFGQGQAKANAKLQEAEIMKRHEASGQIDQSSQNILELIAKLKVRLREKTANGSNEQ